VTLTPEEVREVRFGTTRARAGYKMGEVDAFLDSVEAAIAEYSSQNQRLGDEADVLRSQVQQLQTRLAAARKELDGIVRGRDVEELNRHDTLVTPVPAQDDPNTEPTVVVATEGDYFETTAENPIVAGVPATEFAELVAVRDRVRDMLEKQIALVDELEIGPKSD
jgi:DivIVA domain-containing protein